MPKRAAGTDGVLGTERGFRHLFAGEMPKSAPDDDVLPKAVHTRFFGAT